MLYIIIIVSLTFVEIFIQLFKVRFDDKLVALIIIVFIFLINYNEIPDLVSNIWLLGY